jgi:uncharacterized coiled-coil DUF342 family protein
VSVRDDMWREIYALRERVAELERDIEAWRNKVLDASQASEEWKERAEAVERALAEARARTIEECAKEVESHWNDNLTTVNQHAQAERSAACIRALAAKGEG